MRKGTGKLEHKEGPRADLQLFQDFQGSMALEGRRHEGKKGVKQKRRWLPPTPAIQRDSWVIVGRRGEEEAGKSRLYGKIMKKIHIYSIISHDHISCDFIKIMCSCGKIMKEYSSYVFHYFT